MQLPANEPLQDSPVDHHRDRLFQQGGNPEQSSASSSPQPSIVVRNKFNKVEIRQILNFPPPDDIPNNAQYYQGIMGNNKQDFLP